MKFYDRSVEMEALRHVVLQKNSSMIVISGRRRVGKSRLVDEFMKENKGYKVIAVPKEEKLATSDFAEALTEQGYTPTFNSVKDAFKYFFTKSKERILYVDEFPNLIEVNPVIPFELQRIWDMHNGDTDKILILSGSYVSMMDRIFTRQKAPLFNRASSKILLDPLKQDVVWSILDNELQIKDPIQKIINYCIFGGIPYYYEVLEKQGRSASGVNMFFATGQLREEGQDVLRQEVGGAYKKYFSILEAIGYGLASAGEIGNKIGIRQTTLSKYLIALQTDFKLIKREVPFGQNHYRSKKGIYVLNDNLLAFWFSLVYGNDIAPNKSELDQFVSKRFEMLCMDFLVDFVVNNKKERPLKKGRWWGTCAVGEGKYEQREIDLVLETDKTLYIGECKWSNGKVGERDLVHLKQSGKAIKTKKQIKWILFSKTGFEVLESNDVLLFDAKGLSNNKLPYS